MAIPLFWETCHMVNTIYNKLLGYPVPVQIDPETLSFPLHTKHKELIAFYTYLFAFALMPLFLIDVVVEGLLIRCLKVPLIICVIGLLELFLVTIELVVTLQVLDGEADVFWKEYLNFVVRLDCKRLQSHKLDLKSKQYSVQNFVRSLRKGK